MTNKQKHKNKVLTVVKMSDKMNLVANEMM